jgi:hypothetical protein
MGRGSVGTGGQVIAEDSKGKQGHAHERSSIICQLLTNWTFGMRDRASENRFGWRDLTAQFRCIPHLPTSGRCGAPGSRHKPFGLSANS